MKNIIIGITGGSGSGKTYLSNKLIDIFGGDNINLIQMDSYYNDLKHLSMEEREKNNFDEPNAFDFTLLLDHLKILDNIGNVEIPNYDYKTHTRKNETSKITHKPILIIEGIFAIYDKKVRDLMNLAVYIDIENNIRKERRIKRDMIQRERTEDSIIYQYENIVEPMYKKYILPMKNKSNLILKEISEKSNEFNKLVNYINKIIIENEYK
jgi:uridine kinase